MVALNRNLIEAQKLTDEDIAELQSMHDDREHLFYLADLLNPKNITGKETLKCYAKLLEALEYNMQRVWKWPQDKNRHTWWCRIPHCKCPDMDNEAFVGTKFRYFNSDCPIHGK